MALNEKETVELTRLLGKLEWPVDARVFAALMPKIVTVPQELAILDEENRVLTVYREDAEYVGHHMPGTVLREDESIPQAIERLRRGELADSEIGSVENVGWIEIKKGQGPDQDPNRHQVSLLWLARVKKYRGSGTFSPLDRLPKNTLPHHRFLIEKVRKYLRNGKPILGK